MVTQSCSNHHPWIESLFRKLTSTLVFVLSAQLHANPTLERCLANMNLWGRPIALYISQMQRAGLFPRTFESWPGSLTLPEPENVVLYFQPLMTGSPVNLWDHGWMFNQGSYVDVQRIIRTFEYADTPMYIGNQQTCSLMLFCFARGLRWKPPTRGIESLLSFDSLISSISR